MTFSIGITALDSKNAKVQAEIISHSLFNDIRDIRCFKNTFVWVDNINQKCINGICNGDTDIYLVTLE